jgi:hypothetical protein
MRLGETYICHVLVTSHDDIVQASYHTNSLRRRFASNEYTITVL